MVELNLSVELNARDRVLLEEIRDALKQFKPTCGSCAKDMANAVTNISANVANVVAGAVADHPVESIPFDAPEEPKPIPEEAPTATPEPAPAPTPEPEKAYTLEDVRKVVMAKSRKGIGVKTKVKEILNKYAESVPALPPDKYAAFVAELETL